MARYNSLIITDDEESILNKTAWDQHGNIMALSHPRFAVYGIQFHPESCASILGMELLSTFLSSPTGLQQKTSV
jgi:anthranilate/para-aminobenzoate synthase component II